jgi:hypothetical protein
MHKRRLDNIITAETEPAPKKRQRNEIRNEHSSVGEGSTR